MPKYCPECGSLMDDYSDFCRECGARSSTHHGKYVPWSAKKSINSQKNSKKVFSDTNDSFSRNLVSDNNPRKQRRGIFKILPTFIGLISIILIFCLISSGTLNFDAHHNNKVVFANSTNNSNSQINNTDTPNSTVNNNTNTSVEAEVDEKTYLLIDYNGAWLGSVGTTEDLKDYSGNNSKKIEFVNMDPNEVISASVQKQDASENCLTIQLIKNGVIIKEAQTNTPYGVVTVTE